MFDVYSHVVVASKECAVLEGVVVGETALVASLMATGIHCQVKSGVSSVGIPSIVPVEQCRLPAIVPLNCLVNMETTSSGSRRSSADCRYSTGYFPL